MRGGHPKDAPRKNKDIKNNDDFNLSFSNLSDIQYPHNRYSKHITNSFSTKKRYYLISFR